MVLLAIGSSARAGGTEDYHRERENADKRKD
jgi:hypothetical protein